MQQNEKPTSPIRTFVVTITPGQEETVHAQSFMIGRLADKTEGVKFDLDDRTVACYIFPNIIGFREQPELPIV